MKLIALLSCCLVVQLTVGQIAEAAKKKSGCKGEDDRNATNYDDYPCSLVQVPLKSSVGDTHQSSVRQLPYVAKIITNIDSKLCGGAILSQRHILTVRECTEDISHIKAGDFGGSGEQTPPYKGVKLDKGSGLAMIIMREDIWMDDNGEINCILPSEKEVPSGDSVLISGFDGCGGADIDFPKYRWSSSRLMSKEDVDKQSSASPKWVDSKKAIVATDMKGIVNQGMPMTRKISPEKYELVGIAHTIYGPCKGSAYIQVAQHLKWIRSFLKANRGEDDED